MTDQASLHKDLSEDVLASLDRQSFENLVVYYRRELLDFLQGNHKTSLNGGLAKRLRKLGILEREGRYCKVSRRTLEILEASE